MVDWKISVGNGWMQCENAGMKIRIPWAGTAAVIAGMMVSHGEEIQAGEFIRVKETDESAMLQTAFFGYEKDGVRVDLIGAIHLADRKYFETLNSDFVKYEALLFEMVGGERLGGRAQPADDGPPAGRDAKGQGKNLEGLRALYASMEKALGLTGQAGVIDYTARNFVHADLTMEEFEALQKKRGESMLSFMIKAGLSAEKPSREPDSIRLMSGLLSGRTAMVKREVMHTMAAGDKQINSIAGENVIIADRNAKCMEILDKEIAGGKKHIGIFYGAAHLPDMERRLSGMGYSRVSTKWLTAWEVAKE